MKTFAAVALIACVASAETDLCKAWKTANESQWDCNADKCTHKDANAAQAVKDTAATVHAAYKIACDGATSNFVAVGSLAVAAAALAF